MGKERVMKRQAWIVAHIIAALALWTGLSGCGGGGSSDGSTTPTLPQVQTGYFVDGPVVGLRYATATQSGYTDSQGAFKYRSGEVVRFYVGDILIGQKTGSYEITPFDLAGIDPPQSNLEIVRARNEMDRSARATSFDVAANIALFLQSLDSDGDFSNGILIPTQIRTLALGMSVDFEQDMWVFREDFQFRKLMAAGRNAGLWGGTRAIRSPLYALDTLYAGLGITPEIYVPQVVEGTDEDSGNSYRTTYVYGTTGNLRLSQYDRYANGSIDETTEYVYDSNGNITEWLWDDDDSDMYADETEDYIYDDNGNLIEYRADSDGDGIDNYRIEYEYDANGSRTVNQADYNNDGAIDWINRYFYDSDGNMTRHEYDADNSGSIDVLKTYVYDANGNEVSYEKHDNYWSDAVADERSTSVYDSNGNITEWRLDSDGDNDGNTNPDAIKKYSYDASGNMTQYREDDNGDGSDDYRTLLTYDNSGNLIRVEIDSDNDGAFDEKETYTYDTNGNLTLYQLDEGNNGSVDYRETYDYDARGNYIEFNAYSGGSASPDSTQSITYQSGGAFKSYYFFME